jgi:hypothetical protein
VPVTESGSLLIVRVASDGSADVEALDLGAAAPSSLVTRPRSERVFVLEYACGLGALDLGASPGLHMLALGSETTRPLPTPNSLWVETASATFTRGDPSVELERPPLSTIGLLAPGECRPFVVGSQVATATDASVLAAYDGATVDVVTQSGHVFRFTEGSIGAALASIHGPRGVTDARWSSDDRELWIIDSVEVWRGAPGETFQPLAIPAGYGAGGALALGPAPVSEVFTVTTASRTFGRLIPATGAWELIKSGGRSSSDGPAVVWLGPGEALGLGPASTHVVHYKSSAIDLEPVGSDAANEVVTMRVVPGLGVLIGTDKGGLYLQAPGTNSWSHQDVGIDELVLRIEAIAPLEPKPDYVIAVRGPVGGDRGHALIQISQGKACSPELEIGAILGLVPTDNGVALLSRETPQMAPMLRFLRRPAVPDRCPAVQ